MRAEYYALLDRLSEEVIKAELSEEAPNVFSTAAFQHGYG